MCTKLADDLVNQLKSLPCFEAVIDISAIEEGHSHHSFIVQTSSATFIAKYFESSRVTAKSESTVTIEAAQRNLAPRVHYVCDKWLISEFINASSLSQVAMSVEDKIKVVTQLLVRCHQLTSKVTRLDLTEIVHNIIQSHYFSVQQQQYITALLPKLPLFELQSKLVLCHGDANFSNTLWSEKPMLIDFECVSMADREFDLAMFIAINRLSENEIDNTIKHYQTNANGLIVIDKSLVTRYLNWCYLINGLWYYERSCAMQDDNLRSLAFYQLNRYDEISEDVKSAVIQMR